MKKRYSIILTAILVIITTISSYAEVEFPAKTDVPIDKEWEIKFNMELDWSNIDNSNIYITNENGERIDNTLVIMGDKHSVRLKAPVGGYDSDSKYKIHVLQSVRSVSHKTLKEKTEMEFHTTTVNDIDVDESSLMSEYTYGLSNVKNEYLEIGTDSENVLEISGAIEKCEELWIRIEDKVSETRIFQEVFQIDEDSFSKSLTLDIKPSVYYNITIYIRTEENGRFDNHDLPILLINHNGRLYLKLSEDYLDIYLDNVEKYNSYSDLHKDIYLKASQNVQSDSEEIIALANEIIGDENDDYEKLRKIHDWVASNIDYDRDGYHSGDYLPTDALSVLKNKKAVCSGYSRLTAALLRAIGIETRIIHGAALGVGTSGDWDSTDKTNINHAWNEAFINGRWVIIDTTWDSSINRIKDKYFDPTLEKFSSDHLILEICDY
ncbi:transglutaminase-like domain-containing protein [Wukongibacter baidiensis]|uniref:transglutaminase domain-containing protein n=1 Tax=Wukongibacter baidiensis TaxID=1723361 RepID=UPI003D7F21A1